MAVPVSLALGSGGARGYAHIGVIREIEARGYEIGAVAGSSMGALVGGLFAAGKMEQFAEWATGLGPLDVIRLLDPTLTASGVIRAERILDIVRDMLGGVTIEELDVPFTAVATDLTNAREIWFQRGPVDTAIRASIAIPGVIAPFELEGRLFADGGILNPLPVMPNSFARVRHSIGVTLGSGEKGGPESGPEESDAAEPAAEGWIARARRSAVEVGGSVTSVVADYFSGSTGADDADVPVAPKLGRVELLNRSLEIVQAALTRHQMASCPPDVLIEVPRTACRTLDFHRATEMIDLGRALAVDALDRAGLTGEEND
ncbi:esterase [Skermania sp. ID1734]|uniref:patatin-like phospholipase family protein n=1 Tax=Skermania sp. ID1734 TaxID=2597516 RepID=UPI0011800F65|nr:patatin-like phospholipase family protein [Skermania sp. ID1734]TSE01457.1 esterase [Skermania sp. ID1734]